VGATVGAPVGATVGVAAATKAAQIRHAIKVRRKMDIMFSVFFYFL
jgi:hypothetical protein